MGYGKLRILGVMSGSSPDGIDMALCDFSGDQKNLDWRVLKAETISLSDEWVERLRELPRASAMQLAFTDYNFGYLTGRICKEFLNGTNADFIASHGHTVFHHPDKKMTCQIGNGAAIAALCNVSVVNDFRSMDIALSGQGTPLTSVFDRYFFEDTDILINLGGIVNISFNLPDQLIAYDIGSCNQLLNYLSRTVGMEYDEHGTKASEGVVIKDLLDQLISHPYFEKKAPKSLDNSYVSDSFRPLLNAKNARVEDKLRTVVELIVISIKKEVERMFGSNSTEKPKMLITGGGVHNSFLVNTIHQLIPNVELVVPDHHFINYKEAIMMAFLGYLRVNGIKNVLSSVTGSTRDTIGGAIYHAG